MGTPSDDLEALIGELNADLASSSADAGTAGELDDWIRESVRRKGSDLLLVSGSAPVTRVDGLLTPIATPVLEGPDIEAAVFPVLPPHAIRQYRGSGIVDASFRLKDLGRFRINPALLILAAAVIGILSFGPS